MTVTDQLTFSKNALNKYAQKIGALIDQEVATEESFYPDFRDLLKNYFSSKEFEVISVPKAESTEDKPDFIIYMDNIPIINIEAKNPYDPIDKWILATSKNRLFKQIYRYRGREISNIPVIITDFLQIWVIDNDSPNSMDSDHQVKYKFKIVDDSNSTWKSFTNAKKNFEGGLNYACEDIAISITKVSSMIPHLVKYAKKLKNKIIEVFNEATNPMKIYLESIRNDFLKSIFSSDKEKKSQEFADLFSQTLIYGGFIAWMRFCKDGNNSQDFAFNIVSRYLPYGTFIYSIFSEISVKLSPEVQNKIISKIERIFQSSNFERITENTETLMITFYSDFLQQYDPEMAKDRGIVYTPHPIVNFITRGVDYFIKKYFNKNDGLASEDIYFLDPAAGTMAFPVEILRLVKDYFKKKYSKQPGRILNEFNEWVQNQFLNNVYAFEILMAPYVLGHFRINMVLEDLGTKFNPQKNRVKLFLFNTLMELQTTFQDFRNPAIGEEIVEALNIRNKQRVLIILSNPPYNVSSQNKFNWIEEKMKIYYENIQRSGRKKLTGLTSLLDDYVKFIRFAQWKVVQNNYGIVAFITNNYYLDGLTFRGMRNSILKDFDKIYVINLHGDIRKGVPEHISKLGIIRDENVFGNRTSVGVAIVFFIRSPQHSDKECEIRYIEKWGLKSEKFIFLENNFEDLKFQSVPIRLDYELMPDIFLFREIYEEFPYLVDIFKKNIQGIITGHDDDIIGIDLLETKNKIKNLFIKYSKPPDLDNKLWNPKKILETSENEAISNIRKYVWRGFNQRFISYEPKLIGRTSFQLMQYLITSKYFIPTLIINRRSRGCKGDSSVFISDIIFDNACIEGSRGLKCYAFPLKINISDDIDDYKNPKLPIDSNINEAFKQTLIYKNEVSNDDIFFYIYGILYSPTYRDRYHFGLKEDYPRIPFPKNKDYFIEMSNFGKRLAELHLIKAKDLDTTIFPMSKSTDYKIYNVRRNDKDENGNQIPNTYDPKTQKIYFKKRKKSQINAEQEGDPLDEITWIGGITQKMWDFEIGGRQQLKEWLYSRRYSNEDKKNYIQRPLNSKELEYFLKICDAIKKTIELLPGIDTVYKKIDP